MYLAAHYKITYGVESRVLNFILLHMYLTE